MMRLLGSTAARSLEESAGKQKESFLSAAHVMTRTCTKLDKTNPYADFLIYTKQL